MKDFQSIAADLEAETLEACAAGAVPICRRVLASGDNEFPQLNTRNGRYTMEAGYLPGRGFRWSGFLAGRLWLLYDLSGTPLFRETAHALAMRIAAALKGLHVDRGNIGFDVYHGICLGFEVTGDAALRDAAMDGARAMEDLYCESAGVYWQSNWLDAFVSETPACLLPILWAHRHGATDVERIRRHVHKSLDGGMLRDDGSVQHRLLFDRAGAITGTDTSQGFNARSTWSRAQAWMLHSLASCVESFGDERVRDALARAARWYRSHVPADGVLYYDFDDPRIGEIPRDSCGTLIGAVALRRCADLGIDEAACRSVAERGESEILRNYVSPGGVVLHGSWGVGEGKSRWNTLFPQQDVMPYGNYWLLELLHRRARPASTVFRFRPE